MTKAVLETELVGSCEKTRSHGIKLNGDTRPLPDVNMVDLSHRIRKPGFSFGVNMAGLASRHDKDKAESSHSHDKAEEEAAPRDRPQGDDRRYLTTEEVKSIWYQHPRAVHLLNKYEQQYDRRRHYDEDDKRSHRSNAEDRRYRQRDGGNDGYERHARRGSREPDNVDRHWDCPFFRHCWDSGMSRLPTIGNCPECKQKKKGTAKVSVFERLGLLPPWSKHAESVQREDREELEDDDEEDKYHRPRWCPDGLSHSQKRRVQRLRALEEAERKRTPDDAEELLAKIGRNHDDWSTPEPTPTPIVKKRGMIKLNDEDMREAKKSLKEKGIKPEDVKNLPPIEDICETIPPSSTIEDPLYPEGHPKRVEQDSQPIKTSAPSKKKKKKHKNVVESSEPINDPNSISISDAETESGNEHEEDNDKNDTPDKEEIEKEPEKHAKNKKYTKEDFITEKHGAVIDCNKGMVTFNVDDKEHTVYFPKRIDKKGKMKKFKFGELFKKATTSTGRPSRASTQIRRSYNEDVIAPSFAPEEDHGAPNASSFPCYEFLTNAGLLDDFFTLVNRAGLATYVGDERGQYYRLTKIFVESFKFHNTEYEPTVAFKIYDIPVTMKLEEFCFALGIAPVGTARRIDDNPRDLLELYRGITGDDCRTIQRGKIRNIQLPAIKYFAYYIGTSILGRENTSNISSYHLAFLNVALTGETPYHLGSLIARRLSSRGPIFGGTIASRILTHLDIPLDSNDVPLTPRKLDIAAMKSHHFVTTNSTIDNIVYKMLFADGNEKEIPLPQQGLFNIDRQSWSLTKEVVEEHMKIQEFHQQHDSENVEPSYDYTVTYPDVSSSTYMEPGRSSSYYEDTTSWGPWE
ncbi:hypothetical protein QYE76_020581 [Lolium multiflorum]|uniref:Arabidopsis retrotransposon Orf1 C-terminal domain-containing protein n=1 Tax=Lolium multiflorum TaxID=4521 RepID=A0AAD8VQ55_LOLMU|nr:hypothetical protein QYE76_020581 [Lolium multiflorum]